MKLAIFIPSLQGGGAERVSLFVADMLAEAGHDVDLVVARAEGELQSHPSTSRHLVALGAPNEMACLPHLVRYIDSSKPDLLFAVIHSAKIMAGLAKKLRPHLSLALSVRHSLDVPRRHRFWPRALFGYGLERWLYRDAVGVHVVSRALGDEVARTLRIPADRIALIYNPLRRDVIGGEIAPEHLRYFDRPVLISAGRLVAQKDQRKLIDAFQASKLADVARLMILGEGPLHQDLERHARDQGLGDTIVLPGFVANIRPYLRRSCGFLLSSRSEGLGNVLLEALAAGLPIASFDCPVGPREVLSDGELGRLIRPGDVDALAHAMEDMVHKRFEPPSDDAVRAKLREFEVEEVSRRYLDFVDQCIARAGR